MLSGGGETGLNRRVAGVYQISVRASVNGESGFDIPAVRSVVDVTPSCKRDGGGSNLGGGARGYLSGWDLDSSLRTVFIRGSFRCSLGATNLGFGRVT